MKEFTQADTVFIIDNLCLSLCKVLLLLDLWPVCSLHAWHRIVESEESKCLVFSG